MTVPRVVTVGHVEWVTHALGTPPRRGLIADLAEPLQEPAGGGGVAAAAAARMGAHSVLLTALGSDDAARRSRTALEARGVELVAASRAGAQTPVLTITEPDAERTIMVVGGRLQAALADGLHGAAFDGAASAYYTGEDAPLLRALRHAVPVLVVTGRRMHDLIAADVRADVVVASANDPDEDPWGLPEALRPAHMVITDGPRGGTVIDRTGARWAFSAAVPPGPVIDTYGCGDTFAAGLAVGLATTGDIRDAVAVGARGAAQCATWRGGLGPA